MTCKIVIGLFLMIFTISCAADPNCKSIKLDSLDRVVNLETRRIEALARSNAPEDTADFVLLNRPPWDAKVKRIALIADLHPLAQTECKAGPDITNRPAVTCAKSIPDTKLKIVGTFATNDAIGLEERMDRLATFVTQVVFCQKQPAS